MSSKFSSKRKRILPPPHCKPKPPPGLPILPLFVPEQLSGYIWWQDLDPLAPTDRRVLLVLTKQAGAMTYTGCEPYSGHRLCANLTKLGDTDTWTVTISIYDQWRNPENFNWPAVPIAADQPFDTGTLRDVHVPEYDQRWCRFTE